MYTSIVKLNVETLVEGKDARTPGHLPGGWGGIPILEGGRELPHDFKFSDPIGSSFYGLSPSYLILKIIGPKSGLIFHPNLSFVSL